MEASLDLALNTADFIAIEPSTKVQVDLRYATADNFMGRNVYGAFNRALLHKEAAEKFMQAVRILGREYPQYSFRIYDALRPRSVQYLMWEIVRGTSNEKYVANPERGSIHNFGFAVDLTLVDADGQALDMGTDFDEFSPVSEPQNEAQYQGTGRLSSLQLQNRRILREVMASAGFIYLPTEWWHFDAMDKSYVRQNYRILE